MQPLGFIPLPAGLLAFADAATLTYLGLVEMVKRLVLAQPDLPPAHPVLELQHTKRKEATMIGRSVGALSIAMMIFGLAWAAQRAGPPKERLIASIQGPALYRAYCAACHGPEAKGNGPVASTLKIAPADLTRISARNGGTFPLMRIERIISGEEERRGHGAMPAWGPVFSEVDRDQDLGRVRIDNLARYLRDIQAK
jgi:mono/diheme cytochrome c family protein